MQNLHYINLSNDQRDQLIPQSPNERVELLRNFVAEESLKVSEHIEDTLACQVLFGMVFVGDGLDGMSSKYEIVRALDGDIYFGDYSDNSALVELVTSLRCECPHLVLKSVSEVVLLF